MLYLSKWTVLSSKNRAFHSIKQRKKGGEKERRKNEKEKKKKGELSSIVCHKKSPRRSF